MCGSQHGQPRSSGCALPKPRPFFVAWRSEGRALVRASPRTYSRQVGAAGMCIIGMDMVWATLTSCARSACADAVPLVCTQHTCLKGYSKGVAHHNRLSARVRDLAVSRARMWSHHMALGCGMHQLFVVAVCPELALVGVFSPFLKAGASGGARAGLVWLGLWRLAAVGRERWSGVASCILWLERCRACGPCSMMLAT